MYVHLVAKNSTHEKLVFEIRELMFSEKDYDDFRIKIENSNDWVYFTRLNSDQDKTSQVEINNLEELTSYKIVAEAKHLDVWHPVIGATFVTEPYSNLQKPPSNVRNEGGLVLGNTYEKEYLQMIESREI